MKLLDYGALKERGIPYSKVHLRRLIKAGRFPVPIKLGEQRIGFIESEIDEWIKSRMAARHAQVAA